MRHSLLLILTTSLLAVMISIMISILSGCSSIDRRGMPKGCYDEVLCPEHRGATQIYPGVEYDLFGIFEGNRTTKKNSLVRTLEILTCVIDLPFSLVFDTILFPFDLIIRDKRTKIYQHIQSEKEEQEQKEEFEQGMRKIERKQ